MTESAVEKAATLPLEKLDELERLAEKATPADSLVPYLTDDDGACIDALDPATIKSLIAMAKAGLTAEAALAEARGEIERLRYTIRLAHYWSKHGDRPQDCFNVLNNATAALGTLEAHHSFNPTQEGGK